MLPAKESDDEILLGNKQLILIFLAVAVLLGVAFTGGFVVGRGGMSKKATSGAATEAAAAVATSEGPAETAKTNSGQTHTVGAVEEPALDSRTRPDEPVHSEPSAAAAPLGSRKPSTPAHEATPEPSNASDSYVPNAGSKYLQVAAVNRDEAEAVADVLHRKGFRAHAVPKPGSPKIYRVIIGPVHDAGDLSSTRDSLRKTGFREVIVQSY